MVLDLEAQLRGVPIGEAGGCVDRFFAATKPDLLTISPADFKNAVENAVAAGS
jgi:lipoate-protein ligase A